MQMARSESARSFRWRVFAVAMLSVGTALVLVLLIGWHSLIERERVRLDERLCMEGRRLAGLSDQQDERHRWDRLSQDLALKLHVDDASDLRLRVTDVQGVIALQSRGPWPLGPAAAWRDDNRLPPVGQSTDPRGRCRWVAAEGQGRDWQAVQVQLSGATAELAVDSGSLAADLRADLRDVLLLTIPVGILLSVLGAALLSGMTMRPLKRLREAMRRMGHQALSERLSDAGEDQEFRELIAAYNTMLGRIEASFHQASRFSADAAHELRTPLTILRGRLERAIGRTEGRAVQEELGLIQDEVGRLVAITRKLLMLSQADAGRLPVHAEPVDLTVLLQDLIADAVMLTESQTLLVEIDSGLQVAGDRGLLQQLFNNLVSNALRYRSEGGWIQVQARRSGHGVEVLIANPCLPLDAAARARFFERFYRADPAHGRRTDGTGLGLSLVREIARAHGGEASLQASVEDEVRVRVWLPV
ncbi:HAMP domain-containing protein [Pelomonas sp. V22]|uniref:ATP-binding protein n=1 Tax=Pelomonas sp. V22 TaxID=2822139 RepID=UPI0024A99ABD|nr:ATP-binding protein [Pelomonas sp. V22]MDI4634562.1 HAMP domain-containing protein [Pelomonas sp. V22]